jgi:hypothetical protein
MWFVIFASLYVNMPVLKAEKTFGIKLAEYIYTSENNDHVGIMRVDSPSTGTPSACASLVPSELQHAVLRVFGVCEFPPEEVIYTRTKARAGRRVSTDVTSTAGAGAGKEPGDSITPPVIREKYELDTYLASMKGAQPVLRGSMSCAEFQDEEFLQTDVDTFTRYWGLQNVTVNVIGHNPKGGYFGEGSLDTEYLIGTAPGIDITWWGIVWGSSFTHDVFEW